MKNINEENILDFNLFSFFLLKVLFIYKLSFVKIVNNYLKKEEKKSP